MSLAGVAVAQQVGELRVEQIVRTYCAPCHGETLEGGVGGSLVDGNWRFGGTDKDIARSIAKGNLEMGMTPWEGILSPDQIRSLVIYIRELEAAFAARSTNFPVPSPDRVTGTQHHAYRIEMVVEEGLEIPWAIAFLPDGRKLVTERPGGLRMIGADGRLDPEPIRNTPAVVHHGQGGLMEVALHPDFADNGWLYLGLTEGAPGADGRRPECMTAVARGRIRNHEWVDHEWIWRADPKFHTAAGIHFGTRFVFDDGYLFFVVGERGGMHEAQDLARPNGKIFRLHDDGRVPADNPFVDTDGAIPGIWSYGHRNPQGLDLHPATGDLYSTEHGPRGGDELNLILRGANYGWPVISYGMNYDGKPITDKTHQVGMEQPIVQWTPVIAACGLDFYRGDKFPRWKHDLFAGGLVSQELRRLRIENRQVVEQELVLKGIGRVRDVAGGPDGFLYVVLNDPHHIVRLIPAD
jgi:glucose/arabinose dehydrogenase